MVSLEIRQVNFAYFNGFFLRNIDFFIKAGEMAGLLGPNGCGKSTLIKLASGILKPKQGEVRLDGSNLNSLSRKSVARSVAVVPQQFHIPFAFTVNEVVMLGRTPFLRTLTEESKLDRQIVARALELVGITWLRKRLFGELSGGERQKVILAMALAQEPKLLLLDEPTSHLDIAHQVEILELVRKLNVEQGLTIMAAMHDLNLAALYFDRLILLKEGQVITDGPPAQVLTEAQIRDVFLAEVTVEPHPVSGVPHIVVIPREHTDKRQNP
jgi:iron complex transport system ATP-binding protein